MTKYLKLTNTEKCLELAECLVGSKCVAKWPAHLASDSRLLGVGDNYFLFELHGTAGNCDTVEIPLDTLKLNPFKCMEHKIHLSCVYDGTRRFGQISSATYFRSLFE
jgi:hypothetical protein